MGRALVIKGLNVTNPLTTVTLNNVNSITENYYSLNTSILESEKSALNAFIQGLIDENLWGKIKYFYPLLGDNVQHMLLDVVDQSTEDLFSNAANTGLSVSSRTLIANTRPQVEYPVGSRANSIDASKFGIVLAGKSDTWFGGGQLVGFNTGSNLFSTELAYALSGYGYPRLVAKGLSIRLETAFSSVLERVVFGNINNGIGSIYNNDSLLASASVNTDNTSLGTSYGLLSNYRANNYKYNFFAMTEGMTDADWAVYYLLLLTFLRSVGKHS